MHDRTLLPTDPNTLKPILDSTYEFKDVLRAYERIMSGRAVGKVVVKIEEGVD
jgi:NADPH:quinone reductase-like Zn-dependent oxidoreductase